MTHSSHPALTGKQKQFLRGLGHHLSAVVIVGKDGLSEPLLQSVDEVLSARELIKVKLGQNCPLGKKQAAHQLAASSGALLVQLIGRTILLYRPNENLKEKQRIHLPR